MSVRSSVGWIWGFVALGVLASIFFLVMPVFSRVALSIEARRYVECEEGKRSDCTPAFSWSLFDRSGGRVLSPEKDWMMFATTTNTP